MNKELILWHFIAKRLKTPLELMLLVVVESWGSSPGRTGFKMAVDAEGALCGSVGGGMMEIKLVELAKKRLKTGQKETLLTRQIHRKTALRHQSGMICSGEQSLVLVPLAPPQLGAVLAVIRCLKNQKAGLFCITPEGMQIVERQKQPQPFSFERLSPDKFRFSENIGFKNHVYIVGGGHCALALSELLAGMDFYIHLFDDRADLNTLRKNRFVHKKQVLTGYEHIAECIPSGADVFVVVMTVGYRSDEIVIRQLLGKTFRYFGVLGSAAKIDVLMRQLATEGFPVDALQKIHSPIGLPINSHTPEEIAVSIAAEIISVKNANI